MRRSELARCFYIIESLIRHRLIVLTLFCFQGFEVIEFERVDLLISLLSLSDGFIELRGLLLQSLIQFAKLHLVDLVFEHQHAVFRE